MSELIWRAVWKPIDYAVLVAGILFALWWATPLFFPASQFIDLELVQVGDGVAGEPTSKIEVVVSREVYRDADIALYEVGVRNANTGKPGCFARRERPYEALSNDDPRVIREDLAWWAWSEDGECVEWKPEPGQYRVRTRHCWQRYAWARRACNDWKYSNIFTIKERS